MVLLLACAPSFKRERETESQGVVVDVGRPEEQQGEGCQPTVAGELDLQEGEVTAGHEFLSLPYYCGSWRRARRAKSYS